MQRAGGSAGIEKAAQLIAQAKKSVADTTALKEAKQDFRRILEEYERIVEILEKIEQDVQALLGEIPIVEQLRSVKGLGPIFIAAILSGAGDTAKIVVFASLHLVGSNPVFRQLHENNVQVKHMKKHQSVLNFVLTSCLRSR